MNIRPTRAREIDSRLTFARFGPLNRCMCMDIQDAPKLDGKRHPKKTFRQTLRDDQEFRIAAKRIGLTSFAALFLDIAMIWLLRARLIADPNTTDLLAFISFTATLVVIYGVWLEITIAGM